MHLLRCFADRGFRSDDLHVSRHDFPKLHPDSAISSPFFFDSGEFIMFNLMEKLPTQGALQSRLSSHSPAPTRVLHTADANHPSARAMQDGVPLALLHFLQAADRLPMWAPQ